MTNPMNSVNHTMQLTLINHYEKTFALMSAPGTDKIEVLAVEEVPEDIRSYFLDLYNKTFDD